LTRSSGLSNRPVLTLSIRCTTSIPAHGPTIIKAHQRIRSDHVTSSL
jgi:hypothetical protein